MSFDLQRSAFSLYLQAGSTQPSDKQTDRVEKDTQLAFRPRRARARFHLQLPQGPWVLQESSVYVASHSLTRDDIRGARGGRGWGFQGSMWRRDSW